MTADGDDGEGTELVDKNFIDEAFSEGADIVHLTVPVVVNVTAETEHRASFDDARQSVTEALLGTRRTLADLRGQRLAINERIRLLVEQEKVLASMDRILQKGAADGE